MSMVSGGYLLLRLDETGHVSASACVADVAPLTNWVSTWRDDAVAFGLAGESIEAANRWLDERQQDVVPWHLSRSPAIPTKFGLAFRSTFPTIIVGISIEARRAEELVAEIPGKAAGVFELLASRTPPAVGGEPIGYELLSTNYIGIDHSWRCYAMNTGIAASEGLSLNQFGLLDSSADADAALRAARSTPDSPPDGDWDVWQLTRYDV